MIKIAEYCIRCGLCIDLYPELFYFDDVNDRIGLWQKAQQEVSLEEIKAMAADCPVAAIHVRLED